MLTLLVGGARSGKSSLALRLAQERAGTQVAFVATAAAGDSEMADRIRRHQADRPAEWATIEESVDLAAALGRAEAAGARLAVIDCLTLWLANMLEGGWGDERILAEVRRLFGGTVPLDMIAVTNEVGEGIVPDNALARRFRDLQGRANQIAAAAADEVLLVVAGLPLALKGARSAG